MSRINDTFPFILLINWRTLYQYCYKTKQKWLNKFNSPCNYQSRNIDQFTKIMTKKILKKSSFYIVFIFFLFFLYWSATRCAIDLTNNVDRARQKVKFEGRQPNLYYRMIYIAASCLISMNWDLRNMQFLQIQIQRMLVLKSL